MFRTILLAALFAPAIASAVTPMPTDILVRVGFDLRYYYGCSSTINGIAPGDPGASVLNLPSCNSLTHQQTYGPPWSLVQGVTYGDVYLPDQHFSNCSLIRSQLIVGTTSAHQTITIECPQMEVAEDRMIYADGFDHPDENGR